ncbi:hypothetical protein GCM10025864_08550 [Luteimicrobium album]|uniref:Secreted protein n=1 Tax=Luteimicrobium album TaxID=1054550 RepID=A0ABQ6HX82_9MICO|nr:hypothetical protein [Luteimicrobium album]GMA23096.1 hypothetical protein GCM10025864_08550 [Luteimicrobium album]
MTTTPDPLAGDVPTEPAPRTGWRRFTPWLAALLAVVVVVGWQVVSRNPSLEAEGTTWSSPTTVTCGDRGVSLHASDDENVTDGSPLYAVLVRNASQFPVKLSTDSPAGFRVTFSGVVDAQAPRGEVPKATTDTLSLPTGQLAYLVVSAASPLPETLDGGGTVAEQVKLHTTTLGTTTSQSFELPDQVMIYAGDTPPQGYSCS